MYCILKVLTYFLPGSPILTLTILTHSESHEKTESSVKSNLQEPHRISMSILNNFYSWSDYNSEKHRQLHIILAIIVSVFSACVVILVAYMVIFPAAYTEVDTRARDQDTPDTEKTASVTGSGDQEMEAKVFIRKCNSRNTICRGGLKMASPPLMMKMMLFRRRPDGTKQVWRGRSGLSGEAWRGQPRLILSMLSCRHFIPIAE